VYSILIENCTGDLPEREFPIQYHVPILPKEVMAVGKCLILSKELYNIQCYGNLIDGENVFLVVYALGIP